MTNLSFTPPNAIQFEVKLNNEGQMSLSSLIPGDEASANAVAQALVQVLPFGAGWESEYRSLYILSGQAQEQVSTLADVQAIAVPAWRKLRGTLVSDQLSLSKRSTSEDGEIWQPYPSPTGQVSEQEHPAFALAGAVQERYTTLQWKEGRIDLDPDPPSELLDLLEFVVQAFNGQGQEWKERHDLFGGDPKVNPAAKRIGFEVRGIAPLLSEHLQPFLRVGELEFWPLTPMEYSRDAKKWERYTLAGGAPLSFSGAETALVSPDDEQEMTDPFAMLSQMFDIQSSAIVVHADGTLDWNPDDFTEQQQEALRHSILQSTGAGDPQRWAEQLEGLAPTTPRALRLQVMKALLDAAPDMLDQSYAPVAYTLDGQEWTDLRPDFDLDEEDEESDEDDSAKQGQRS